MEPVKAPRNGKVWILLAGVRNLMEGKMLGSSGDIYAYATHISNHSINPSLILFHPSQSAIEGLFNVANDRCRIYMVSLELYINVRSAKGSQIILPT